MRFFIELFYNGTPFYGWQVQPQQVTVQGVMENAMGHLLQHSTSITGCGRTDTGVHARQFFAHFESEKDLSPDQLHQLTYKLNSFLPKEIVIHRIFAVPETLHARFSAQRRTYKYYISTQKDAFRFHYAHRIYPFLNVDKMNEAARLLIQTEDFTSFSKLHTQVNNNICHVDEAFWQMEDGLLVFTISADRFLRNMVRSIVGTLIEVGEGKIGVPDFQNIINQRNRCAAGMSMPAHALFLHHVAYDFSSIQNAKK